jgi:virulence factor Mce-like protein
MVTQAPKRSAVAIAVAFALSCVGLIIFVWTQFGGTVPFAPQGYRIKVLFAETGLLVPNADVRISGVNIGKVVAVQARGTNSLVTLDIDQQYSPIPADTRAILREKTLLGEAYIELSPGNRRDRKLPDGGEIPISQVAPTQQLDQVLASFDTPTQHNLQKLLNGMGAALNGRGQAINDWFGNLDPSVNELAAVVGVLNQQQAALRTLINTGATTLGTLSSHSADLQSLVTAGDQVFASTAARNAQLTATVNALPPFLAQLRTTLGTLNRTLGIARPSLDALMPVAPLLTPALRDLTVLTGPVIKLLGSAPGVLRAADLALPAIRRFSLEFRPAVDALLPAAQQVVPMIDIVGAYRPQLEEGMTDLAAVLQARSAANTQATAGTPAGIAHYIRSIVTLGGDTLFGQTVRSPGVRVNAYPAPGEVAGVQNGLSAATCSNTGNRAQFPLFTGNVPCKLQSAYPWDHGVTTSYYPHVRKAAP